MHSYVEYLKKRAAPVCGRKRLSRAKLLALAFSTNIDGRKLVQWLQKDYNLRVSPTRYTRMRPIEEANARGLTHLTVESVNVDYGSVESELGQDPAWCQLPLDPAKRYVCIDGVNCTGKTSLLLDFPHMKITDYCGDQLDYYNVNPETALSYLLISLQMLRDCENVLIDRSPVANLAYQYCYYLMSASRGNKTMTALCEEYTKMHNLLPLLEYLRGLRLNVVILLDSNVPQLAKRLYRRGVTLQSRGDVIKSAFDSYGACQNAAYAFLANQLDYACIDLQYFRLKYGVCDDGELLQYVHAYLKSKIASVIDASAPRYPDLVYTSVVTPQFETLYTCALALSRR